MTRPALVANLLTLLAFPIPSAAAPAVAPAPAIPAAPAVAPAPAVPTAPAVPAAIPQRADEERRPTAAVVRAPAASPEIGLGSLQLLGAYAVGIGGMAGLIEAGICPKKLGIHSDFANVA